MSETRRRPSPESGAHAAGAPGRRRFDGKVVVITGATSGIGPLASDEHPFMTGAQIVIDGGKTANAG